MREWPGQLDVEPESLRPAFALPWGTSLADERRSDRTAEMARIRDDCRSIAHQLLRIDQRLRANADAPYR